MERHQEQIAFMALGASCIIGAYLIAQLQMRVRRLEKVMIRVHAYIEADFQETVDEKFEEIVEDLRDE
jgi:hypothetical protein